MNVFEDLKSAIRTHLDSIPEGKIPLIAIIGPTAVGKTELSIGLCREFNGEVISADSRQVYKGMDIGTDKITEEEMDGVPHHMLNVVEPDEEFSVYDFKNLADELIPQIHERGNVPFIVGGTMLYTDSVIKNFDFGGTKPNMELRASLESQSKEELHAKLTELDPEQAAKIHKNNTHYLVRALEKLLSEHKPNITPTPHNYHALKIGFIRPREELYQRINDRVEEQLDEGKLEAEAKFFIDKYGADRRSITGLGYRQFIEYFNEEIKTTGEKFTLNDVKSRLQRETRNFAKRQLTWWKKDPEIKWFDVTKK